MLSFVLYDSHFSLDLQLIFDIKIHVIYCKKINVPFLAFNISCFIFVFFAYRATLLLKKLQYFSINVDEIGSYQTSLSYRLEGTEIMCG